MLTIAICKRIAADLYQAFLEGGEVAAMALFREERDLWAWDNETCAMFDAYVMDEYRDAQQFRLAA